VRETALKPKNSDVVTPLKILPRISSGVTEVKQKFMLGINKPKPEPAIALLVNSFYLFICQLQLAICHIVTNSIKLTLIDLLLCLPSLINL
jgi:hypothetical protein